MGLPRGREDGFEVLLEFVLDTFSKILQIKSGGAATGEATRLRTERP